MYCIFFNERADDAVGPIQPQPPLLKFRGKQNTNIMQKESFYFDALEPFQHLNTFRCLH